MGAQRWLPVVPIYIANLPQKTFLTGVGQKREPTISATSGFLTRNFYSEFRLNKSSVLWK
jgi:hypothetical protein